MNKIANQTHCLICSVVCFCSVFPPHFAFTLICTFIKIETDIMDADVHVFPQNILLFFLHKNESFQLEPFVINLKYISVCSVTDGAVHR